MVKVWDENSGQISAIKLAKNTKSGQEDAQHEIKILQTIAEEDDHAGKQLCVRMESNFNYHGHICIVFECLELSIADYMFEKGNKPMLMSEVQDIFHQMAYGVKCKLYNLYIIILYTNLIIFFI